MLDAPPIALGELNALIPAIPGEAKRSLELNVPEGIKLSPREQARRISSRSFRRLDLRDDAALEHGVTRPQLALQEGDATVRAGLRIRAIALTQARRDISASTRRSAALTKDDARLPSGTAWERSAEREVKFHLSRPAS